jgi:hypothetical protein
MKLLSIDNVKTDKGKKYNHDDIAVFFKITPIPWLNIKDKIKRIILTDKAINIDNSINLIALLSSFGKIIANSKFPVDSPLIITITILIYNAQIAKSSGV